MTMLLYPDAQKKAQEELDKVIGDNAFPSFGDRPSLPYVEALISEVLRWHPVTPIAFPHMLKEDDIIGQYFVPKGTTVIGNTWWVHPFISKSNTSHHSHGFQGLCYIRR